MQRIAKRKTAKPNRRVARKAPAQHPSNGFSQGTHVPVRYPLFPRQLQFSSTWNRTIEVDLGATDFTSGIGLFDYLGNIPEYALECYSFYRYSRIAGVDVTLTVVGEADESSQNFAFQVAMAKIPFDQVGLSPEQLRLVRGSKYSLVPTTGMNKCVLKGQFGAFDELGNPVYDRTYWQSQGDAFITTPADTNRPVIGLAVRSVNGNRGFVSINISVVYHMQFFELEYNRIPGLTKRPATTEPVNYRPESRANTSRAQRDDPDFADISDRQAPKRR